MGKIKKEVEKRVIANQINYIKELEDENWTTETQKNDVEAIREVAEHTKRKKLKPAGYFRMGAKKSKGSTPTIASAFRLATKQNEIEKLKKQTDALRAGIYAESN